MCDKMKKYGYIIIAASIAIMCLQVAYIRILYRNYISDEISEINRTVQSALEKELDIRTSDKFKEVRYKYYKQALDMTPEERRQFASVDPDKAEESGMERSIIHYIAVQSEQDKAIQYDLPLDVRVLDSIYVAVSKSEYQHTFLLYDEHTLPIDSVGKIKTGKPNYLSVLYPIGTQGRQYLQVKVKIPASGFMKRESWLLLLSVCLLLILSLCMVYQFMEVRKLHGVLQKRGISVNGILHDMKAPLNSIITVLGRFNMKTEDVSIKEAIEENQSIVKHLVYNIESLLIPARRDRQRVLLNKTKIDVYALVEMIKKELSSLYKGKFGTIDIINNLPNKCRVSADSVYIENVMRNLLENALKYSDDHVSVMITLMIVHQKLQVSVKDNGWGIAPAYRKKVFTPFYQIPRKKVRMRNGTGIGLAHVKYIIDEHGGSIHMRSEEEKGSVFTFSIPLA